MTQKELEAIEEREWPELLGAVARGWCHDANANKVMDEELATAIAKEVMPFVAEAERRGERKALEWLRDNASGGGDWRMKIELRLNALK